ncbi:hypothetical protein Q0M94_19155 (plasmid) [Deinococcus radiomollis]|uniref:hypothetical protein n=1 Tax=Deinococcus radiomollis TaxID=468916 RepID=UPI003891A5BE
MWDGAIIGSYSSEKLVINSFDVSKKNTKNIQQAQRRKVTGLTRQELLITLSGFLVCSSFEDLETELDQLQAALNQKELKLVIGNRPDHYYNVVWDGSTMPRKPNGGGYVLPVSFNFTGMEETSLSAIPADLAIKFIPEVNYFVDQSGNKFNGPQYVYNPKTVFVQCVPNAGFEDVVIGTTALGVSMGYKPSYATNSVVVGLYVAGTQVFFKHVPDFGTFTVGLTITPSGAIVYINGVHYDYFGNVPEVNFALYPNANLRTNWVVVAKYSAPKAYVNQVLNVATGDNIIKTVVLPANSSSPIVYSGTSRSYASLITTGSSTPATFTMNDYGAGHTSPLNGLFTFNGITSDVVVQWTTEIPNVIYVGKTLFPYMNTGINTLANNSVNPAVLAYFDRWI